MKNLTSSRVLAAALALCLASQGAAAQGGYICKMTKNNARGYVPNQVQFLITENGVVQVKDALIMRYLKAPVAAKATKRGDSLRLRWKIAGVKDVSNQRIPTLRYEARLDTVSGAVRITARPSDAPQTWAASGTCTRR